MIYLDHAAAAQPPCEVLDFYRARLEEFYANQEAAHLLGYEMRRKLDAAAEQLSNALTGGRFRYEVVWGTSGTELFHLIADSPLVSGKRVLSSVLEHPALTANLRRCAGELTLLPVDRAGAISARSVSADFTAFHLVQSELGRIQNVAVLSEIAPGAVRMLDAIQAAGRLSIPVGTAELIVVSGHKFGSPGGAAILVDPAAKCARPFQEFARRYRHTDYRIGRPEAPLLLTMAYAAELRFRDLERNAANVCEWNRILRSALSGLLLPNGKRSFCTIPPEVASPWILHVTLPGIETGVLVRMLSEKGIMVAAGSACSSESREPSPALVAIGFRRADAWSGLRISLGPDSSREEVEKFIKALREILKNW